ncbi:Dbl homology domain-containing protein [Phycomyces nitens]|nr:Dbl homology domain-containing protein [Phycomyces nitens]
MPLPSHSTKQIQTTSLYHTCCSVLNQLSAVEGMMCYLEMDTTTLTTVSSEPSTPTLSNGDPLSKLWAMARLGSPLCTLFNVLSPETPLHIDADPTHSTMNTCKKSIYHFLVGCRNQLGFTEEDVFTISDLYQDDTNGFVKVVNTISKLLLLLEERGIISAHSSHRNSDPNAPKDTRDKVVLELIESERTYVQYMETLQNYMRELQSQNIVSSDCVHYLFGNLNSLVDFQRRFLFQLEEIAEKSPEEQRVGYLFSQMEEAFAVYEPYCANYYSAQHLVVQEAPKLQKLGQILNPVYELPSILIRPVQRICKYPLLLIQLLKSTSKDWKYYKETEQGLEAIRRVTEKVNETQRQHENVQAVEELKRRVCDLEDLAIDTYGNLLLQDKMIVSMNENERELHCFLFEKVILMCKYIKESKNILTKGTTLSIKKKRRGSLQSKCTIYANRILGVHNKSSPGSWTLLMEYKEKEVEQMFLRFRNEEQVKKWESTLLKIKVTHKANVPNTHLLSMPLSNTPNSHLSAHDGHPPLPSTPASTSGPITPLPRTSSSITTGLLSTSPPFDYGLPASPPPSTPSSPTSSRVSTASSSGSAGSVSPGSVKVKLSYHDGIYVIVVPQEATFLELMERVERKIRLVANLQPNEMLKLKYPDEDGDHITISSDDDVLMAFESRGIHNAINLFVSL